MKDIIIGLGICIGLYSTFIICIKIKKKILKMIKKKEELNNKEEKEELNNKEEINIDDKSTQTENLIKNIDGKIDNKEIVKDVLDDIVTTVENQDKKTTVSFDEDFEVIQ